MADQSMEDLKRGAVMIQATAAITDILDSREPGQVSLTTSGPKGGKVPSYLMTFELAGQTVTINIPANIAEEFASKILPMAIHKDTDHGAAVTEAVPFDRSVND